MVFNNRAKAQKNMKIAHMVAFILLVVGGLNWGLVALGYNLVESLLGTWPVVVMIVYGLVGLSAIFEAVTHKSNCKNCEVVGSNTSM